MCLRFFPSASRRLLSDLGPLLGRHPGRPRFPAHAPQRDRSGVLPVLGGDVLNLAGRDLADHDGSADDVGGALLAFRASWHYVWFPDMLCAKHSTKILPMGGQS